MSFIRSRKHTVSRLSVIAATLAVSAPLAFGDETPDPQSKPQDAKTQPQDKVTITGDAYQTESLNTKSTASLVNTPQTLAVISDKLIREQSASTLTEALRNSPGVGTFYLGENGNTTTGDAIFMRGTDASGNIFVDGVRDIGSISRDTFNIEQIEVLKGAAGADIGRGSATGAINTVTKRPKNVNELAGSVGIGDGEYVRAALDGNWKIDTHTAVRLNVMNLESNVVGRNNIENSRWGVAPTIGFGIGGTTRGILSYTHIEQDNIPDGGVLTIGLPGYTTPNPGTRDFLNTAARVSSKNFYGTTADHDEVTQDTLAGIIEHDFSDQITLTNVTRWGQNDQVYRLTTFMAGSTQLVTPNPNDPSTWTFTRSATNRNATNITLTNQTNLRATFSTGPIEHVTSSGIEFIREQQKTRSYTGTGTIPPANVYNPQPLTGTYVRALSRAYTKGETDTVAAYFNDTMQFTPQWLATIGLRLDNYKTDYDSIAANGAITHFTAEDDLFSGKVGLVFKPTDASSIYGSYAITKQPPGGANFTLSSSTTVGANNPEVEPQEAKTYEVGGKWNLFNNRLGLTGAVYRTEYSDGVAVDTDGTYYRTGQKSVEGIELGVVGSITPDWNISAGYTIMDTKVKNQTLVSADGSTDLAYSPTDSFTLWTTYNISDKFTVGGGARYNGDMKRGTDGAVGTPKFTEGYTVIDGYLNYKLTKNADLQLNIYNLFDEDYVASINKSGYRYTPGGPRSARVTLNFSF